MTLHSAQVLDCDCDCDASQLIAGIDWVTAHHVKPAVANVNNAGVAQVVFYDGGAVIGTDTTAPTA